MMHGIQDSEELKNRTFVITSNDLWMLDFADRVVYMDQGWIGFDGGVEELKRAPRLFKILREMRKRRGLLDQAVRTETIEVESVSPKNA